METKNRADMFFETGRQAAYMFVSIKKFLERNHADEGERDLLQAMREAVQLLLDGVATHTVRGRESDLDIFRRALKELARQVQELQSPIGALGIASDAVDALETYYQRTTTYLSEANEQFRSMLTMLTETVADLSGHTDTSVARLHAIEKHLEQVSGLEDRRALTASLQTCLTSLREAAAQQRSSSAATVQKLRQQIGKAQDRALANSIADDPLPAAIDLAPELAEGPITSTSYVAAFKLQRAGHIASRYGENVKNRMLSLISAHLKTVLGPGDRLLRWKGLSFVMFINTIEGPAELRRRLTDAVAATGQQYIEVGRKSALLSVAVDWILFPQSQCPSFEAVLTEVDAFLTSNKPTLFTRMEA